jgi:uncharacterized membrane protein
MHRHGTWRFLGRVLDPTNGPSVGARRTLTIAGGDHLEEVLMVWMVSAVVLAVVVVSVVFLLRRNRTQAKRRNPNVDRAFEDARARVRKTTGQEGSGGTFGPGSL